MTARKRAMRFGQNFTIFSVVYTSELLQTGLKLSFAAGRRLYFRFAILRCPLCQGSLQFFGKDGSFITDVFTALEPLFGLPVTSVIVSVTPSAAPGTKRKSASPNVLVILVSDRRNRLLPKIEIRTSIPATGFLTWLKASASGSGESKDAIGSQPRKVIQADVKMKNRIVH